MKFKVVIPARYASSRLPAKPLADICGKPMIQHTYEQALKSGAEEVVIATDDTRIVKALSHLDIDVVMTSDKHNSGTERLAEVCQIKNWEADAIVVNVQGDEPMIAPEAIQQVAKNLAHCPDHVGMATLCEPIQTIPDLFNPNIVKVHTNAAGLAINFSRAPQPWARDDFMQEPTELPDYPWFRHIGLYAYRAAFIQKYVEWPECELEKLEALEQLRVLWHGESIHVEPACVEMGPGVDTPEDLERVRALLS